MSVISQISGTVCRNASNEHYYYGAAINPLNVLHMKIKTLIYIIKCVLQSTRFWNDLH